MIKYTQLRNGIRENLEETVPLLKPYTIAIDPSSICNFKCNHCLQGQEEHRKTMKYDLMPFEGFKKIVDSLVKWKGPRIKVIRLYNSGEPMLNEALPRMMEYLRKSNVANRIEITSNCSLLDERIAASLIVNEIDYIKVSIYEINDKKHKEITRSNVGVMQIYENVAALRRMRDKIGAKKPYIAVKMFDNISPSIKKHFEEMYKSVADEIYYEYVHDFIGQYVPEGSTKRKGKEICPYPFYFMLVHPNGDVGCCCNDFSHSIKIGNAFESDMAEIWEGKSLKDFQILQASKNRKNCKACEKCDTFLNDLFTPDNMDNLNLAQFLEKIKK